MQYFKPFISSFLSVIISFRCLDVLEQHVAFFNTKGGLEELLVFLVLFVPVSIILNYLVDKLMPTEKQDKN